MVDGAIFAEMATKEDVAVTLGQTDQSPVELSSDRDADLNGSFLPGQQVVSFRV